MCGNRLQKYRWIQKLPGPQIRKSIEQTIALLRTHTTLTTRIRERFMIPDLGASMAAVPVAHFPSEIFDVQQTKNDLLL